MADGQGPGYGKDQFPFDAVGVALAHAVDRVPDGLTPVLENWRPEIDGTLSVRPGQGTGREVVAGQSPVHSIMRLEDSSTGALLATEIVGTGTHVATCATDLASSASRDTGYSGDPLSIIKHRPVESLREWAYVADRLRMRKFDQAGNRKKIGLPIPAAPPTPALDVPRYKSLDEFNSMVGWSAAGTAALAGALNTRVDGATRTVTRFLFDSGTTGWACVRPSSMADVGVGTRLTVDSGGSLETVTVQETFRGTGSTTITSIIYQSGAGSGLCAIHLATPFNEIEPNSLMFIDNGAGTTEYVRVLAISKTPEGLSSIVCSTTNTFAAGHAILAYPSFRAYFTITHANGVAMSATAVEFVVTAGKGWIDRTIALDLSLITTGVPTQHDDLMHIDMYVDDPSAVVEARVMLDIDSATNDFTRNYMFKAIRAEDLTPAVALEQTILSNRQIQRQRELAEAYQPPDGIGDLGDRPVFGDNLVPDIEKFLEGGVRKAEERHLSSGSNQWAPITFKIGELLAQDLGRVGTDLSRGLQNVARLRVLIWCSSAVTVRVDGWWIGGGHGPEVAPADRPFIYRVRGRDSSTGVVSNWSPASRVSVRPQRQKVLISSSVHPDGECDFLDFERYGGQILGWYYVGSVPNSGSPQLDDTISPADLSVRQSLSEGDIHYELWPIRSTPLAGTCNTSGPLVQCLGFTTLPAGCAIGNEIKIGGKDYTIAQVVDVDTFWLTESAGAQFAAAWEMAEPLVTAQPLPILAGPYYDFYFGAGDLLNPQRVYYTNGNDCDTTQDTHYFDIPGENVQAIGMVGDRMFIFGIRAIYPIEPSFSLADSGGNLFSADLEVPTSESIFSRWAWCSTGDTIVYLGRSGRLFDIRGRVITDDLYPLFPHEGSLGVAVNGFQPPNVVAAQVNRMRLSYAAGEVFFDYIDTSGNSRTLVWSRHADRVGWRPYSYAVGAVVHYAEAGQHVSSILLGGVNGQLYRLARAQADAAGASIVATVRTPSKSFGDDTNQKIIKEVRISYDTDGATINLTPGFDNHSSTPFAATPLNEVAGRRIKVIDFNNGSGQLAYNLSLLLTTTVTTQRPTLYFWTAVLSPRPDTTNLRTPDYRVGPHAINYIRGLYIHADTFGVSRSALLEYVDDSGSVATVAITGIDHDVLTRRYYPLATPIYACAHRIRPNDVSTWQFLDYELDADPAPPKSTQSSPIIDLGGARFVHGVLFDVDTSGANVDMTVKVDQGVTQTTIANGSNSGPVNANGRAQLAYSFEIPFITHLLQFIPSAACRIWSAKPWSNPEPELAYMWKSQQTNCGWPGWKIFGDGKIAVRSTEAIRFFIIADGTTYEVTFYDASTNTAGARRQLWFRCPAIKAKSVEFMVHTLTEAGRVAIYEKDFSLEIKGWGFEGGWRTINPLGAEHFNTGAPI